MKNLLSKIGSYAAAGLVILFGLAMAGLGLTVMAVLALFAAAVFAVALIAAPFVGKSQEAETDFKAKMDGADPVAA